MGRRAKEFVPLGVRTYVRRREHELRCSRLLRRGTRALGKDPRGNERIWEDLVEGWDDKRWAAGPEYLDAIAAVAVAEEGPILECGSGLTTLVLAAVAQRTGSSIWSLEHDARCFHIVESRLRQFGLDANVQMTPLRAYGDFDWYDVDRLPLPTFSLVVCDGPPKRTRGGRVGLVPVLGERLAPGCLILLDDAARPEEREVLRRWASDRPLRYELRGASRPYAAVELAAPS
jgi:predicted O-methyltransferase YrrM